MKPTLSDETIKAINNTMKSVKLTEKSSKKKDLEKIFNKNK
jgi:hypothetical protein